MLNEPYRYEAVPADSCPYRHRRSVEWSKSTASRSTFSVPFQNTIRFLFEQRINQDQINHYFHRWQELAPDTSITYLIVPDPVEHYEIVLPERGEDWTQKLFAWVERTPVGIASNLHGKTGFVEFWSVYQELCLELLDSAFIEVKLIEARSWNDIDLENLAIGRGLFSYDGA